LPETARRAAIIGSALTLASASGRFVGQIALASGRGGEVLAAMVMARVPELFRAPVLSDLSRE